MHKKNTSKDCDSRGDDDDDGDDDDKLMMSIISESHHTHQEEQELTPFEQKGCSPGSRGTKDQLPINMVVLRDAKRKHENLEMVWIEMQRESMRT